MLSNRLAFAALAIACIGAAAGGGYLATRQNTVPTPASAQVQQDAVAAVSPAPAASSAPAPSSARSSPTPVAPPQAVQETEAVVGQPIKAAAPTKTIAAKAPAQAARASARDSRAPVASVAHAEPLPLTAASNSAQPPAPPAIESAPMPRPEERVVQEPIHPVEPQHTVMEYVVSADSVIGLQTENRLSSETARVEDRVEARVTRDVRVGGHVAIPAGARALGSVMQVERGGKFKERARLGIRFHTLVLADGTRIPISTETIFREGESPSNNTAPRVGGGAVAGTILGAILGGGKGAAIGAAAGAGAGAASVAASDRNAATLPAGTAMTVRILQPISVAADGK
jgi:hypothetical protein